MRRQDFDRDGSIESGVLCALDFAHAARTQWRLDFIRAEFHAGSKSHRWAQL